MNAKDTNDNFLNISIKIFKFFSGFEVFYGEKYKMSSAVSSAK